MSAHFPAMTYASLACFGTRIPPIENGSQMPGSNNQSATLGFYWWKGRDSNPRPRHYEHAAPLKIGLKFNNLPQGARCDWHDEAQPSTTDSRKLPAICHPTLPCGSGGHCPASLPCRCATRKWSAWHMPDFEPGRRCKRASWHREQDFAAYLTVIVPLWTRGSSAGFPKRLSHR